MIHFCTLFFRILECQILTFVYLWISHIKKFARKIAKFEATLLTQRLVPIDSGLTQTEPLSAGLGAGKEDLLFESILGRCASSIKKLQVKNGYCVKIWWGAHIPICTNAPAIILSGMGFSCNSSSVGIDFQHSFATISCKQFWHNGWGMVKLEVFIRDHSHMTSDIFLDIFDLPS